MCQPPSLNLGNPSSRPRRRRLRSCLRVRPLALGGGLRLLVAMGVAAALVHDVAKSLEEVQLAHGAAAARSLGASAPQRPSLAARSLASAPARAGRAQSRNGSGQPA